MTQSIFSPAFSFAIAALLVAAAVSDFRRFTIPNWIVLSLIVLWLFRLAVSAIAGTALLPMTVSALAALAVLAAGAFVFQHGWLGGGDVKLLAATVLWLPAGQAVGFLSLVALLGGALAAVVVAAARLLRPAVAGPDGSRPVAGLRLPYGIAIAGAGLLILFDLIRF